MGTDGRIPVRQLDPSGGAAGQVPTINPTGDAVEWATAGGGGTSGFRVFSTQKRTSGNLTFNTTGWQNVDTGIDLTFTGVAVGDVVYYGLSLVPNATATSLFFDVATIVGGAPVNYFGTAGGASDTGWAAWFVSPNQSFPIGGTATYVVQAGDLSVGSLTLRLRIRNSSTTARILNASATVPLHVWAEVWRP